MTDKCRPRKQFDDEQIERIAESFREINKLDGTERFDLFNCLYKTTVWTIEGSKTLAIEKLEDVLLLDADAKAVSDESSAVIKVKKTVWSAALEYFNSGFNRYGGRRGIFTLTHELAHVILCHGDIARARLTGVSLKQSETKIVDSLERDEREANRLAAALLMGRKYLQASDTGKVVSEKFGVSVEAAEVRLKQTFRNRSAAVIDGFKELLSKLGQRPATNVENFACSPSIPDHNDSDCDIKQSEFGVCSRCKMHTLRLTDGNNQVCTNVNCRNWGNTLPDGDRL